MDLNNKSMALLLVTAIVISLGGTIVVLNQFGQGGTTGLVPGRVNLSITSSTACRVESNVTFGTGRPTAFINLSTDTNNSLGNTYGFNDCSNALTASVCRGMIINNTGNSNINVTFTSDANATTLLSAQTGLELNDFTYWVRNGTYDGSTNGCVSYVGARPNGTVQQTANDMICRNLTYTSGNTHITLEYNISLEADITSGGKQALITITCQDAS